MGKLTHILVAFLVCVSVSRAESILLRGATVHTVAKGDLSPGEVLVRDGRIAVVAAHVDGPADRTIDLAGLHLYPGMVSPGTDLGLVEISGVRASVDDRET